MKIKTLAFLIASWIYATSVQAANRHASTEDTTNYNKKVVYYQSNITPNKIISAPMQMTNHKRSGDEDFELDDHVLIDGLQLKVQDSTPAPDLGNLLDHAYRAFKAGQTEAAASYYLEILAIDKHNSNAQFGLANIYHINGQLNQAKVLYSQILKREPTNQRALNNYLSLMGDQHKSEVLLEFRKLEAINPGNSVIPAQIAMIYLNDKNYTKAIKYFKKAVSLDSGNTSYHYNLAICYDLNGNKHEAISHYQHLVNVSYLGISLPTTLEVLNQRISYLSARS